ncbi:hypothetical protein QBC46DRAFT_381318, partial [Diplogelasinospora grovesii]
MAGSGPGSAPGSSSGSRPIIKAFPLSNAARDLVGRLAASVKYDQEATGQNILLAAKAMGEAKNWSAVSVSRESWAQLFSLRAQLMAESDELIPVVSAINPAALYMSENAMVVQFVKGLTTIKSFLTMEDDCGLVIPLSSPPSDGSTQVTVADYATGSILELDISMISEGAAFVVPGTASMGITSADPLVCVIFCLAGG